MADHVWTVLCTQAIVEAGSNQISLIAIVEDVSIHASEEQVRRTILEAGTKDPTSVAIGPTMELVTYWVRSNYAEPELGSARIAIQTPSGEFRPWQELPLDLQAKAGWRIRVKLPGVPMLSGLYRFWVQQKTGSDQWDTVAKIPFTVDFQPVASEPIAAAEPTGP